ncbi:MAG: hypothetical protein IPI61_13300 [Syntrophaceae bacterium]|nr:hypothetical protein [Syntrophaceae bacterium]
MQWGLGPFALEAEFRYIWGTTDYDGALSDIDRKGWDLYLNGKYTMGAFYGGLGVLLHQRRRPRHNR